MNESIRKKVDESWKEQVEREKQQASGQTPPTAERQTPERPEPPIAGQPAPQQELPEARFDLLVSSLAMDALIALGDAADPATKRPTPRLPHARYIIDLLGVLEDKTRGNLSVDEERLLKDTLYQLRMRYLAKSGG